MKEKILQLIGKLKNCKFFKRFFCSVLLLSVVSSLLIVPSFAAQDSLVPSSVSDDVSSYALSDAPSLDLSYFVGSYPQGFWTWFDEPWHSNNSCTLIGDIYSDDDRYVSIEFKSIEEGFDYAFLITAFDNDGYSYSLFDSRVDEEYGFVHSLEFRILSSFSGDLVWLYDVLWYSSNNSDFGASAFYDDYYGLTEFYFRPGLTFNDYFYSIYSSDSPLSRVGDSIYGLYSGIQVNAFIDSYIYPNAYYDPFNLIDTSVLYDTLSFSYLSSEDRVLATDISLTNTPIGDVPLYSSFDNINVSSIFGSGYNSYDLVKFFNFRGSPNTPYVDILVSTRYSSLYINGTSISPSFDGSYSYVFIDPNSLTFDFSSFNSSSITTYIIRVIPEPVINTSLYYESGFKAGITSSEASEYWEAFWYPRGYSDGLNATESNAFINSLLGDTLSGPMNAINNFVIYEASNGLSVTMGNLLGAVIGLSIFIAILKIFAGG